ncbi:MAG: TonB-dependent receptor, partial [Cytophagales bacterium]|nr:TonB-dependent receptor [Cytophagales bacterium]
EKVKTDTYSIYSEKKRNAAGTESSPTPPNEAAVVSQTAEPYYLTVAVSGRVTDDKGEGLPGVTVIEKGTTNGTTTDATGNYRISVLGEATVLVFSFVGYVTEEVTVGSRTQIDVQLLADIKSLSEVVVIGYGEREKKDLTGAVSSMGSKEIEKSVSMAPEMAMQGRMAGVFVSTPGGTPNARPLVRIRGVGTLGNAEPLYVIDGVPVTEFGNNTESGVVGDIRGTVNVLNLINPNDIESISVLKDASAAAIYGVRAANGVILITTKKGKVGRPKVELSATTGVQNISQYQVLNTQQYAALYQDAYANEPVLRQGVAVPIGSTDALGPQFDPGSPQYLGNRPTADWQGELVNRNASMQDYSLRVSGGSEATTYYVSGGYSRTESPLKNNYMERYSFATNVNSKISKVFSVGVTYRFAYTNTLDNTRGDMGIFSAPPWQPVYDPNGPDGFAPAVAMTFTPNPAYNPTLIESGPAFNSSSRMLWGPETRFNPLGLAAFSDTRFMLIRNLGSAFFQVEPIQGLRFKGTFSGDWYYNRRRSWADHRGIVFSQTPGNPFDGQDGTSVGTYGERYSQNYNLVKEFSINYVKAFGDHNVDVLLNAMDQSYGFVFTQAGTSQVDSRLPSVRNVSGPNQFTNVQSFREPAALQGYLGRVSYRFRDKYYIDATVRRDGSARFAPGFRWGTFPSVAVAWRLSSESFFQNIPFVNDLKLRAGYGSLGNQETGNFLFLSRVLTSSDYAFGSGNGNATGNVQLGAALPDFPVRDLTWEISRTTNVGIDGIAWNNRLSFTFEYYNRLTSGILQSVPLPAAAGIQNQPVLNVASVRNSGVEVALGYNQTVGDFSFNVSANLTTVRNRVESVFRDAPTGGEFGRIEEGFPINYIWGYQVGGIFQTQAEIDTWRARYTDANIGQNKTNPAAGYQYKPGDMWFRDVNGAPAAGQVRNPTPDSLINANDRTYLGKTIPGFFYGINLGASYKGIDLSLFFQGVGDVQAINNARWRGEGMNGRGVNQWASTLDRWTPQNPSSTMPRAAFQDPAQNTRFSSRWVESAAFMRLKNIQLGYTLPKPLLNRLGFIENLRIYVAATNLLTFTRWTGLDPEERGGIPPTRVVNLGLNAAF